MLTRRTSITSGFVCLAVLATALIAPPAEASPNCTKEPKENWLSEDDMKAKVAEMGFTFNVFKVSGNCYEIYGHNKAGQEVEVYFNPVTAAIVKQEIED